MRTLTDQGCPVFIGCGSLEKLRDFLSSQARDSNIVLLHEKNAAPLILPPLTERIPLLKNVPHYGLDSSESNKQIESLLPIWQAWNRDHLDRNTWVVLAGGGVLCDMGGFAASVFKRGIPFINIPTTLLSMADASVGGKTAVDLGEVKNIIGNFRRAKAVAIDPVFIDTLPDTEFLSGMAEILKMMLVAKRGFVPEYMEKHFLKKNFDPKLLYFAVKEKIRITHADFEEKSIRRILNFGHTFGHAFESLALKRNHPIPHGYAVAYGMACELFLSMRCSGLKPESFAQVSRLIRNIYGTFNYNEEDIPYLMDYMLNDKKNRHNGQMNPILLKRYGSCIYRRSVLPQMIEEVFKDYPFDEKKNDNE